MKLFLAAAEPENFRKDILVAGSPNILVSYYHLTNGGKKPTSASSFFKDYHKLKDDVEFIIDSGLFTMMFGAGKHIKQNEQTLYEYTRTYLKTVKGYGYEGNIVEMDVHKVLGLEALQKYRALMISEYDINKIIFVWHIEEKLQGWKDMCKKYPFVALSVPELRIVIKQNKLKTFISKMIHDALQINPNIKIHLLGCTSNNLLDQSGYYSADSSSWQASLRFGDFAVPYTRQMIDKHNLYRIAKEKEDIILKNKIILSEKYNIQQDNKVSETRENYDLRGIISVAFYIEMARRVNIKYYGKEYELLKGMNKII